MKVGEDPVGLQMAKWAVGAIGCKVIPAYCNGRAEKYPLLKGWQDRGTRDFGVLDGWWTDKGYAFPGLIGGKDSGLLVFDCDGGAAVDWFRSLVASCGGLGSGAFVARTPGRGGGLHVYYRWPEWMADLGSAKVVGVVGEVQLRGRGTWTLMAGSRRPDGEYEILSAPDVVEEAPRCLIEGFLSAAEQFGGVGGSGGVEGDLREVSPERAWAGAPWVDNRKNCLAGLAWYLSLRSESVDQVLAICLDWASTCCVPALEVSVVERKVYYAWDRLERVRRERAELTRSALAFIKNRGMGMV